MKMNFHFLFSFNINIFFVCSVPLSPTTLRPSSSPFRRIEFTHFHFIFVLQQNENLFEVWARLQGCRQQKSTTRYDFDTIVSKFAGNREPCKNLFEAAANRISLWQYISFKMLLVSTLHRRAIGAIGVLNPPTTSLTRKYRSTTSSPLSPSSSTYFIIINISLGFYHFYKIRVQPQPYSTAHSVNSFRRVQKAKRKCFYSMNWRFIKTERNGTVS